MMMVNRSHLKCNATFIVLREAFHVAQCDIAQLTAIQDNAKGYTSFESDF